jgi:hypothetical protein
LRKAAFALASAAVLAVLAGALAKPRGAAAARKASAANAAIVVKRIALYRTATWRWERVMGRRPTPTSEGSVRDPSLQYRRWVLRLWKTRARRMQRLAQNPPHKAQWLCIHRYEASWTDTGAPYYGGLQMDISFQRHYGGYLLVRKGTAEHWSPLEQMWVAERALQSGRGYYPWPRTARDCGLI